MSPPSQHPPAGSPAPSESFFALTPERVLQAVEDAGGPRSRRATGYALALNSLENRVYEVELEEPIGGGSDVRVIAKFYRPGRWSREALLAEHRFLAELAEAELPVAPPFDLGGDGDRTLHALTDADGQAQILYAAFPRVRGRAPEELSDEQLRWLGRLVARLHNVGAGRVAPERPALTPDQYVRPVLSVLRAGRFVPPDLEARHGRVVEALLDHCDRIWAGLDPGAFIRLHGDCHLGNLLWGTDGPCFLDFDDFLMGPPVQDLWLLAPGRDEEGARQRELLVEAYGTLRSFDRGSLRLVEPLRAMRILRYAGWVAQRWQDPAFQRTFPDFREHAYWQREIADLEEQLVYVERSLGAGGVP